MRPALIAVASAAGFVDLVMLLRPDWPVALFVLFPAYFVCVVSAILTLNLWMRDRIRPVPERGMTSRMHRLNAATASFDGFGFRLADTFHIPVMPDRLVHAFSHPEIPVFAAASQSGDGISVEFISFFEDGDLTTTSDKAALALPRPRRNALQVMPHSDARTLWQAHRDALRLLETLGRRKAAPPASGFRAAFLRREKSLSRHVRSYPLWPMRLVFWLAARPGRFALSAMADQAPYSHLQPVRREAARPSGRPSVPEAPPASSAQRHERAEPDSRSARESADAGPMRYRVLFRGELREGFTIPQVKAALSTAFGLDATRMDVLFSGNPVLIRSNLDLESAGRVQAAFLRLGARCGVEPMDPDSGGPQPDPARPEAQRATGAGPERVSTARPDQRTENGAAIGPADGESRRFEIRRLLASERAADAGLPGSDEPGWSGYALALSSFLPYWGLLAGTAALILGFMKRRSGGLKIALIGLIGLVFSGMVSFTSVWVQSRIPRAAGTASDPSLARARLDSLVQAIEEYRSETDEWPGSLAALRDEWDEGLVIEDPMTKPDALTGERRPFAYSVDESGDGYTLYSAGRDGRPGTPDDLQPAFSGRDSGAVGWHAPRPPPR